MARKPKAPVVDEGDTKHSNKDSTKQVAGEAKIASDYADKPTVKAKIKTGSKSATAKAPRQFTLASFRNRRKRRKIERRESRTYITNTFVLLGRAGVMLRRHWEIFGGIFLVYGLINIMMTGSFTDRAQLSVVKGQLEESQVGTLDTGISLLANLLSTGVGPSGGAAQSYQMITLLLASLAIIWALRQLYAGAKIRVSHALYNSAYPIIQVLCVVFLGLLQLVPGALGLFMFNGLVVGGIFTVIWQQALVALITLLALSWSAYMLCSTIFALYIVSLPDMRPMEALRTAKRLVAFRRAMILRKIIFLPFALLFLGCLIMLPLVIWATPAASFALYLLLLAALPVVHAYLYGLYRELIRE